MIFYSVRVKIGVTRRSQSIGFQEIDAAQIIKHENFEPGPSYNNDIGLILLEKPCDAMMRKYTLKGISI